MKLPDIQFERSSGSGEWIIFGLGVLCAIFFVWFGFRLIVFSGSISATELFVLGTSQVVGGIIICTSRRHLYYGFGLIAIGFYFLARAVGFIHWPILGYILAVASWFAGYLLLYITYPQTSKSSQK